MRITFLLFLMIFLASCQKPEATSQLDATISGAEPEAKLVIEGPGYSKDFVINNGLVQDTFKITKEGLYFFVYNRNRLQTYLKPGQNVQFNGEAKSLQTSAEFQPPHQLVWEYYQTKREIENQYLSQRQLFSLQPDEFLESIRTGSAKIDTLLMNKDLPAEIVALEKERLVLDRKLNTYIYPIASDRKVSELSTEFEDPLLGISLTDENKFMENPSYADLGRTKFSIEMNQDTTGDYEDVFMKRIAALPSGIIRNDLVYGTMQYIMTPSERLDEFFEFFNKHSSDQGDLGKIKEKYKSLQNLTKGNDSPGFNYENFKGGKSALTDYRGKYVYIDVWATWCGPCRAEIPSLKAKEAKYHDANIEFVSISIDEKNAYEKWRAMVKDEALGGSQLIADSAWKSDFVTSYQINGIPRFILVDPEGKIVTADAPRPSSDKLDKTFSELML